jgi:FtsP/CotA-like multicopper oxidase with cupredoxin domain
MGGDSAHAMGAMAKPSAIQHAPQGMEWEDHMGGANELTTSGNITWIIRDLQTGKENRDIHWIFKQGDRVKIRIYNDSASMHPMPHAIHFHGQRFLVVKSNGQGNFAEMGWKDTYMVGRGEVAELLLDAANPGEWMAHCHIAEHLESSMMFHFTVEAKGP